MKPTAAISPLSARTASELWQGDSASLDGAVCQCVSVFFDTAFDDAVRWVWINLRCLLKDQQHSPGESTTVFFMGLIYPLRGWIG